MTDIELVIKIPKEYYECVLKRCKEPILLNAFKNGTPLPKGHGRLIDADAVTKDFNSFHEAFVVNSTMGGVFKSVACVAPTIIEADQEAAEQ